MLEANLGPISVEFGRIPAKIPAVKSNEVFQFNAKSPILAWNNE